VWGEDEGGESFGKMETRREFWGGVATRVFSGIKGVGRALGFCTR